MLLFEFARLLFKLSVHMPVFEALFQLPPEIGHILRRFPLILVHNPSTNHPAKFIDKSADCHEPMFSQ
jgi:hypothetical protein